MGDLSDEEIAALKRLVPLADEIVRDAEYQKARSIVIRRGRGLVIGLAAFIGALFLLWEKLRDFGLWLFR